MENIFEIATKRKYRFPFKGLISTEDLWDLSLQDLDSIFKQLNVQSKQLEEESLLETKTIEDLDLDKKIQIIKHIVNTKIEARQSMLKIKEVKEKRQRIMELMAKKQDERLKDMSMEELQTMLDNLN